MNKPLFGIAIRSALAGIALAAAFACVASAQTYSGPYGRQTNTQGLGFQQVTAASTFATTSYADLAGSSVTFTPARDPNQTEAPTGYAAPSVTLVAEMSLDVTKATATSGTCALFANGAVIAASSRTITSAAGEGTISQVYKVTLSTSGSQVVKVQCKSGDTNTFTVNQGLVSYNVIY